jgi:hypothetical protein
VRRAAVQEWSASLVDDINDLEPSDKNNEPPFNQRQAMLVFGASGYVALMVISPALAGLVAAFVAAVLVLNKLIGK